MGFAREFGHLLRLFMLLVTLGACNEVESTLVSLDKVVVPEVAATRGEPRTEGETASRCDFDDVVLARSRALDQYTECKLDASVSEEECWLVYLATVTEIQRSWEGCAGD